MSVAGVLILFVLEILLNGYVLSKLWAWFMVPVFKLPVLTVTAAIGISLCLTFMVNKPDFTGDEPTVKELVGVGIHSLIYSFFVLLIGYVISSFM